MTLFWLDTPLDDSSKVLTRANSIEVDPIGGVRAEENPFANLYKQANGLAIDNVIGWNDKVTFTLSEDEYSRPVTLQGSVYFVFELVKLWRRAKFKWIQDSTVNNNAPLLVSFDAIYTDGAVASQNEFNETTYVVLGKVFHYN
jgi:hypothetical protein